MQKIFHYDEKTGVYIGEGLAHVDPMTGEALVPAHATTLMPPPGLGVRFNTEKSTWEDGSEPAPVIESAKDSTETQEPEADSEVTRERQTGKPRKRRR